VKLPGPDDLRAHCERVLAGDHTYLLDVASELIRELVKHPDASTRPDWLGELASGVALELFKLRIGWINGTYRTIDEALGLKRAKNWHQATARKRSRLRWPVYIAVDQALARGAKTTKVFEDVAAQFPGLGKDQAREYYYGVRRIVGPTYSAGFWMKMKVPDSFLKSSKKPRKTKRP